MRKESPPQTLRKELKSSPQVERLSMAEKSAYDLLMARHRSLEINMEDFKDIYGPEEIDRDRERINSKKRYIETQSTKPTKRSKILEILMGEQIELSDWMGPDATTIISSEFDDLFNGVDIAVEFEREGAFKHLAFGVDVTTSPSGVKKKFARIKKHILIGDLTQMKYFTSERMDFHGTMSKIPQVVIGADIRTISRLAELWLSAQGPRTIDRSKVPKDDLERIKDDAREALKLLEKHRVQTLISKEVEKQLEVFMNFAEKHGQEEIAQKYKNTLKIIREVMADKQVNRQDQISNESDDVYRAIDEQLRDFESISIE